MASRAGPIHPGSVPHSHDKAPPPEADTHPAGSARAVVERTHLVSPAVTALPSRLLAFQAAAGNRAVAELVRHPTVQRKPGGKDAVSYGVEVLKALLNP